MAQACLYWGIQDVVNAMKRSYRAAVKKHSDTSLPRQELWRSLCLLRFVSTSTRCRNRLLLSPFREDPRSEDCDCKMFCDVCLDSVAPGLYEECEVTFRVALLCSVVHTAWQRQVGWGMRRTESHTSCSFRWIFSPSWPSSLAASEPGTA